MSSVDTWLETRGMIFAIRRHYKGQYLRRLHPEAQRILALLNDAAEQERAGTLDLDVLHAALLAHMQDHIRPAEDA